MPIQNKKAVIVVITEQDGKNFITLGEGDHNCDRWEISESLLRKIIFEGVKIVFK